MGNSTISSSLSTLYSSLYSFLRSQSGESAAAENELIETFVKPFCECRDGSIRGCWAITEPDHGSDVLAVGETYFNSEKMRGNLQVVLDGDEWVISGQKSAWVSGGTIATHALVHCQIDFVCFLGHRMFNLDTCVHFHEVKITFRVN